MTGNSYRTYDQRVDISRLKKAIDTHKELTGEGYTSIGMQVGICAQTLRDLVNERKNLRRAQGTALIRFFGPQITHGPENRLHPPYKGAKLWGVFFGRTFWI